MTIEEQATQYAKEICKDAQKDIPYVKDAYIDGANAVIQELKMTISVSEEGYLESNLRTLIKDLRG